MPMSKFSRGNFLHAIGNRAVRQAVSALGLKASTAYETNVAAGVNLVNSIASSTVLINEPNLSVDVAGGGLFYWIFGKLYVSANAAAGIKLDLAGGTAAVVSTVAGGSMKFFAAAASATALQTALNTGGGSTAAVLEVDIDFSAQFSDPGQVGLRFAQNVSNAQATIILPGSFLTAIPLDHTPESA